MSKKEKLQMIGISALLLTSGANNIPTAITLLTTSFLCLHFSGGFRGDY